MVRSLTPAVPFRGSRRGPNPREAPLVFVRDVRDTQLPPVPLRSGSAARRWNVREQNTCPSRQCRLSFALFNLFVNLAASFVLQVLWPSKLLSGRTKLSGCPAVLAVSREGDPCFLKRCC